MIVLRGLTERQCLMAEILWSLGDREDIERFLAMLPPNLKQEAQVMVDLMVATVLDDIETTDDADEVIDHIRNLG